MFQSRLSLHKARWILANILEQKNIQAKKFEIAIDAECFRENAQKERENRKKPPCPEGWGRNIPEATALPQNTQISIHQ